LADYWGIEKIIPSDPEKWKGYSAVIINSNKGMLLLNLIKKDIALKPTSLDDLIGNNVHLKLSYDPASGFSPFVREKFYQDLNNKGYDYVCHEYIGFNKKNVINRIYKKIKTMFSKKSLRFFIQEKYITSFRRNTVIYNNARVIIRKKTYLSINSNAYIELYDSLLILGGKSYSKSNPYFYMDKWTKLVIKGQVTIHEAVFIQISHSGILELKGGSIGKGTKIVCTSHISIGKNCYIAGDVIINDHDEYYLEEKDYYASLPITINDNVWIGYSATILKGVTIGEGAVITANTVVAEDVPPYSIVRGNPAQVIGKNVKWRISQ
jgi:acetyltransferase-like isoleucine patch superfamily enzyme